MFRTALIVVSGNASASVLSLLRNLLIARLIPVEDYGVAATFAMAISMVEMLSALGMQQQIVQSKRGGDPDFQAGLQGFSLLRGLISGAVLFFAAGWIAAFLGIPEVAWAYQSLALVPVANGLQHFDVHRLKRQLSFAPEAMTKVMPAAISLLTVWPATRWLEDYRVMLLAIGVQTGLSLCVSHLMAERRFRIGLNRSIVSEALQFGWPLLVNNLLLYLVFNGEKLIVGRELGMAELGILAMGFTLTLTPTLVLTGSIQSFFLPQLSAVQSEPEAFKRLSLVLMQCVLLSASLVLSLGALILPPLVEMALGPGYAPLSGLIVWLVLMQSIRMLKTGASVTAVAVSQTTIPMAANLIRLGSLPLAWWVAIDYGRLDLIVLVAIGGETLGFIASSTLLKYRVRLPMRQLALPGLATLAVFATTVVLLGWLPAAVPFWLDLTFILTGVGVSVWSMTELRSYIRERKMIGATT